MKFSLLCTILAIATKCNFEVHQMDVKAAYLNDVLDEEIYLEPPTGFKPIAGKVWHLGKSIYGTHQGGHVWYKCIKKEFDSLGYTCSNTNHSVFLKCDEADKLICIVAIYVDDIVLASHSVS